MTNGVSEIYGQAIDKLGAFSKGKFDHLNPATGKLQGSLLIEASYLVPTDLTLPTAPQAMVGIIYVPFDEYKPAFQYTLSPTDLLGVDRLEGEEKKLNRLQKLLSRSARVVAAPFTFDEILQVVGSSKPTVEFGEEIKTHERMLKLRAEEWEWESERREKQRQAREREEVARGVEAKRGREAEVKAFPILERVRARVGAKCLGLVFDDKRPKMVTLQSMYDRVGDRLGFQMVFEWVSHGLEAVRLIGAIQKLNIGEDRVPVVVFMDGRFPRESDFESSIDASLALKARLDEAGLPMPYLMGNAGDPIDNVILGKRFPDVYLGTSRRMAPDEYWHNGFDKAGWNLQPWRAIEAAIKPEAV